MIIKKAGAIVTIGLRGARKGRGRGSAARVRRRGHLHCRGQGKGLGTISLISSALGLLTELIVTLRPKERLNAVTVERQRIYGQELGDCLVPLRSTQTSIRSSDSQVKQTFLASVIVEKCSGCGICAQICPAGAMTIMDSLAIVAHTRCTGCGQCAAECPQEALVLRKA